MKLPNSHLAISAIFFATLSVFWVEARAHHPHDVVRAIGLSPGYAQNGKLFVGSYSAYSWDSHQDLIVSNDRGVSCDAASYGIENHSHIMDIAVSPGFSGDGTFGQSCDNRWNGTPTGSADSSTLTDPHGEAHVQHVHGTLGNTPSVRIVDA